ncbi:MAG: hypothetical protein COW42_12850 [Deltaproteobacteria bacterium CG17_big_fil_post_rev_8_21_14_2_50_63_7]|nr:MAG: hypothetical protein COW42_12850 [Deltaproteobacteria bacterium CG17_big_fil_post_rev_8_21_14_2_50_63_7]
MNEMMSEWRAAGVDSTRLELWAIGAPGTEGAIPDFANGADASCFGDVKGGGNVAGKYKASTDDYFVIGADHRVEAIGNVKTGPLSEPANRAALKKIIDGHLSL